MIREGYCHPPSCLSQLPRHHLQVCPLHYPPHAVKFLGSTFKIFPQTTHANCSKLSERKKYFSCLAVSCHVKGNPNGHSWPLDTIGHSWNSLPPYSLSRGGSEMTSLIGEFMKNKLGELSSAQLFSFLLLEVGFLCYSPRGRPFYLTWVCPTPVLLRLGGQICLFLGISRQTHLALTLTYILPLCLQQIHDNCNIT